MATVLPARPAASIIGFQRALSRCWNAAKCSGVSPTISKPSSSSLGLTLGSFIAAIIEACSLAFTSAGRPFGAAAACHE